MTGHEYLRRVLSSQDLTASQMDGLQSLRDALHRHLASDLSAGVRIYYGGSYAKGTMIRESYDLDLVVYFPPEPRTPLVNIFGTVHRSLKACGCDVHPQTVALRIPVTSTLHVDVVPGRAQDSSFRYATLHRNTNPATTLQTSLKVHIEAVRGTDLAPIVRLLKIWRLRHGVPLKTFALEILAARALAGKRRNDYASAVVEVLRVIAMQMDHVRLVDPANANNILEITAEDRRAAAAAASAALSDPAWNHVIW